MQRPSARDRYWSSIAARVNQFSFPAASLKQFGVYFLERLRESCLRELVRDATESFRPRPAVAFFRTAIPVGDDVVHVANEDGIMRQIEKTGMLAQSVFGSLALGNLAA